MILEEIRNIKSRRRDLRSFGLTMGVVLGIIGGVLLWRNREFYPYFLIASGVFFSLGLLLPDLLKPLHKAWMSLAVVMGWVMTRFILFALFFLVVTPIGLLARLLSRDMLRLKIDRDSSSYWIKRSGNDVRRADHERQF
ncbi:MAG: hypothetical protein GXO94_08510 [Nitrospirae bacterium]|nr:hypothetical protein [Nitrospirota bacterium]